MLRRRQEVEAYWKRINDQKLSVMKPWQSVMNDIIAGNPITARRYNNKIRDSIERWLASASGTERALRWVLGKGTFVDCLEALSPDSVDSLHLSDSWTREDSAPLGDLPEDLEFEQNPSKQMRPEKWINFMYHHAVKVHANIYRIYKFHPGKWSPMFMQRAANTLLFFDGVIRVFQWVLKKTDDAHAFYAFDGEVIDKLKAALKGIQPFDHDLLVRGYELGKDDHDPDTDFGRVTQ